MNTVIKRDNIKNEIYEHCLGNDNPAHFIRKNGHFPSGWFDKYMALLRDIIIIWGDAKECPREIFSSVHYASFYLNESYKAWHKYGITKNKKTEDALARIRAPSKEFLLGKQYKR